MIKAAGVRTVTADTFDDEVLRAALPVLVEFTANWCAPCRQLAPVLSAVATEQAGRIEVVQLDVDSDTVTPARYGVLAMPTLLVFRGGEPVKAMVGARPLRTLTRELEDVLRLPVPAGAHDFRPGHEKTPGPN